ncbi:hypothetical protein CPC16_011913 [Podila verticillata]|nr:hypothetical protein CPC16_011913 [Podila verticillata]
MHSSTCSTEYSAPYLIPDHEVDSFLASFSASSLSSTLSPYPLDPFDHPNLQNLPSPYSPMRDAALFERSEEEDSVDGYEIFSTPTPTPDRTPQMSPIQHHRHHQHYYHQHYQQFQFQHQSPYQGHDQAVFPSHTPNKLLEPVSPHSIPVELQLAQLHHQQVMLQQQRQFQLDQNASMGLGFPFYKPQPSMSPPPVSSTLSSPLLLSSFPQFPSSSPHHPFEGFASPLGYLSSIEDQTHRPILENTIPAIDQDTELMLLSSLTLSSPDMTKRSALPQSYTSVELSPSLSWASSDAPYPLVSSSTSSPKQLHMRTSHTTPVGKSAKATRRKRLRPAHKLKKIKPTSFPCSAPGCDKVFSRAYNLTSHMKTHSAERPFLCGVCPLAFARRHDRERHVRLHTGEKPYGCEGCGAGFMRNDALHRHQKLCGMEQEGHEQEQEHGHEREERQQDSSTGGETSLFFLNSDVMETVDSACLPNLEP